jgi:C1A family cysteine protease
MRRQNFILLIGSFLFWLLMIQQSLVFGLSKSVSLISNLNSVLSYSINPIKESDNTTADTTKVLSPAINIKPKSLAFQQDSTIFTRRANAKWVDYVTKDNDTTQSDTTTHSRGTKIPQEVQDYWNNHEFKTKSTNYSGLSFSVDWSYYDSPVKDQKTCGSCWAFAAAALVENISNQANLSEQALISCISGSDCNGGYYEDALEYIKTNGIPPESCYPYISANGSCSSKCTNPSYTEKIATYSESDLWGLNPSINAIKSALQNGPLVVYMLAPNTLDSYTGGIFNYTGGAISSDNGHAVLLVGYNDALKCFKVKNSWGSTWGENGYFRIAYSNVSGNTLFGSYATSASDAYMISNKSFTIQNKDSGTLTITSMSVNKSWLSLSPSAVPFSLSIGDSSIIEAIIDWSLLTAVSDTALIMVSSNDPNQPMDTLIVTATKTTMVPSLSTTVASAITLSGATSGGIATSDGGDSITARGVCWSINPDPTIDDSITTDGKGTGTFTSKLTGLTSSTRYYIRAYATNSMGTAYGAEYSFNTLTAVIVPTITTANASGITSSSATSGGSITSDGGATVTARGICWSLVSDPTIDDSKTTDGTGTGTFTSSISGLTASKTYHIRAYATNSAGTAYGSDISFNTLALTTSPTITTNSVSAITSSTATSGGSVTSDGGTTVSVRGICWGLTSNPTIYDSNTTDGTGTGTFTSSISGLTGSKTYHTRAYATNSVGTAYGADVSFYTPAEGAIPTIYTNAVSAITSSTATSGGIVTANGGDTVIARGVCWGKTSYPTIDDSKTTDGSGTGSFISNITSLTANITYHIRAYATNSIGTAYGEDISFTSTSADELENTTNSTVKIYPNPTNDKLNIVLPDDGPVTIQIINISGIKIYETETGESLETIDVSKFPAGIYTIKLIFNHIVIIKKVVIR